MTVIAMRVTDQGSTSLVFTKDLHPFAMLQSRPDPFFRFDKLAYVI